MLKNKIPGLVLRLLYPPVCPFCGRPVRAPGSEPDGICPQCRSIVPVVSEPFCLKCGKPIDDDESEYCYDCGREHHAYEQGRALYPHTDPMKQAVYDLKYAGRRVNGEIFGRELAAHFSGWIRARNITLVVPVPLHRRRLAQRGYNQAAVIAEALVRAMYGRSRGRDAYPVPVLETDVLKRARATRRLKTMDRTGRQHALEGVFEADLTAVAPALRKNVLLIDDIYTTGSTIDAAAKCLKRAGAEKIYFLTVTIGRGS